ncbi:hypothetical protein [Streptomyces boninensis]|uniref:hypothetical protein n=1 Tax=Streptomyces boninensis TaxID=2039455 RepID=UPI003B21A4FD
MDLESIAEELYGLPPAEFIAARDGHVATARRAKDPALAKQIAALRRPTLAAWASNLLVRSEPAQVNTLLHLGEGLREAQSTLAGDQLRELSRQRNTLVGELARAARRLASEAGHPVGDAVQQEVESTLHAVLADRDAAGEWASGRLVKPLVAGAGFMAGGGGGEGRHLTAVPDLASGADGDEGDGAVKRRRAGAAKGEAARSAARGKAEAARAKAEAARSAADEAEAAAREREAEAVEAASQRDAAADELAAAEARVADLERELAAARTTAQEARTSHDEARRRVTAATRAETKAHRAAATAATHAEKLEAAAR